MLCQGTSRPKRFSCASEGLSAWVGKRGWATRWTQCTISIYQNARRAAAWREPKRDHFPANEIHRDANDANRFFRHHLRFRAAGGSAALGGRRGHPAFAAHGKHHATGGRWPALRHARRRIAQFVGLGDRVPAEALAASGSPGAQHGRRAGQLGAAGTGRGAIRFRPGRRDDRTGSPAPPAARAALACLVEERRFQLRARLGAGGHRTISTSPRQQPPKREGHPFDPQQDEPQGRRHRLCPTA